MKKKNGYHLFATLALLPLFSMLATSCIEDDSTEVSELVSDIEVSGIESSYQIISYAGNTLRISPTITSSYESIDYEWQLLNGTTGSEDADGNVIMPVTIGNEKNLNYDINLSPGTYQVRLVCTAPNGYQVYATTYLSVMTLFSQGVYILKETTDGQTELDFISSGNQFMENLLASTQGSAAPGKPIILNIAYQHCYIDDETAEQAYDNLINFSTDARQLYILRASDLKKAHDWSELTYGGLSSDVQPYTMNRIRMYQTQFLCSDGGRNGSSMQSSVDRYGMPVYYLNSGKFGDPSIDGGGASQFTQHCSPYMMYDVGAYWDAKNHSIVLTNYYGAGQAQANADFMNLTAWECLANGAVTSNSKGYFVLNNAQTGARRLYSINYGRMASSCDTFVDLDANSHMAKASLYTVCGNQAAYLYCYDNGLYACNLNSENLAEISINLQGLPAGAQVSYISNQFYASNTEANSLDYFIVGTRNGSQYGLYFYQMENGIPTGSPVMSFTGTGSVKSVRYCCSSYSSDEYGNYGTGYNMKNVFPVWD